MNKCSTWVLLASLILTGLSLPGPAQASGEEHEAEAIKLIASDLTKQGVVIAPVERRVIAASVVAPGEVQINSYRTAQITTRVGAQIIARRARMGDAVKPGQALVTLSSIEVGQAQGSLVETDKEWRRVKQLGTQVVSDKRYVEAQVARQRAYAALRAYGMTEKQIAALLQSADAARATGEFDLFAPQAGRIISDDFVVGEFVDPGRMLFEITDTSSPWVEAQLAPQVAAGVTVGTPVRVSRNDGVWLEGEVSQLFYRLDAATRTHPVRIEIKDNKAVLAAGEYVDVAFVNAEDQARLAVPVQALVLMGGEQTVFKLVDDELHPQAVKTGVTRSGWTEIVSGLQDGEQIATEGVFLLKSLTLKSQIGDDH